MKKVLLPLGLTLSILLVFVLGIILSENVAKNRNEALDVVPLLSTANAFFTEYDKVNLQAGEDLVEYDDKNKITAVYQVVKGDSTIGTLYFVTVSGREGGLELAVAINPENRTVLGYRILVNKETPSYFAKITQEFTDQFKNADMTKEVFEFTTASGATRSSEAIIRAVTMAREQFYHDLGEEVPKPNVNFVFVSSLQSLSDVSKHTYKMKRENESTIISVVLQYDAASRTFTYVSSDTVLNEAEINAILSTAKNNRPSVLITAYDASIRKLSFTAPGYIASLYGTITFDAAGKVVGYEFDTKNHNESFEDEPSYIGPNPLTSVPADIVDKGGLDGAMNVSGATYTSNAIKSAYTKLLAIWEGNK